MGLRILEVLRLQWAEVGADRIWIRGAVKNRYSEGVLPLPAIVGGLLAEVRRSEARVVTAWTDRIAYSKALHNALSVTFGLQAPEPPGGCAELSPWRRKSTGGAVTRSNVTSVTRRGQSRVNRTTPRRRSGTLYSGTKWSPGLTWQRRDGSKKVTALNLSFLSRHRNSNVLNGRGDWI